MAGRFKRRTSVYPHDGQQLHRYYTNAQDSSSIGKFRIVDIMENSKGEIYFGTIGSGLFKYIPDNDSFCQYGLGNNALPSDYCTISVNLPFTAIYWFYTAKDSPSSIPKPVKASIHTIYSNGILPGVKHLFRTKWRNLYRRSKTACFLFSKNNSTTATIIIISIWSVVGA